MILTKTRVQKGQIGLNNNLFRKCSPDNKKFKNKAANRYLLNNVFWWESLILSRRYLENLHGWLKKIFYTEFPIDIFFPI